MRARALLCLALLPGCKLELALSPELPDDAASVLLLVSSVTGLRVFAHDPIVPVTDEIQGPGALQIVLSLQRRSLQELGLHPGELPLGGAEDTPLPAPQQLLAATVADDVASAFAPIEVLPEAFADLRLALPSQRACLETGGCLDAPDSAGFAACHAPCGVLTPPEPARAPEAPNFLPCPNGWSQTSRADVPVCEPFAAGRLSCPAFSFQPLGNSGCVALGPACARFAADLPAGADIVYVDRAAAPGGDGSVALPFDTLLEGLAAAAPGTVVAIAAGTFRVPINLADGDILWGSCPEQTRIEIDPSEPNAVELRGGRAELHNLSISGGSESVSAKVRGSTLALMNVWAETSSRGIVIAGARLEADGLVLVRADLRFEQGSSGVLSRVNSFDAPSFGIRLQQAQVVASDLAIERKQGGAALVLNPGGLQLERGAFLLRDGTGIRLLAVSTATVSDLVIEADDTSSGVTSYQSRLWAERVRIEGAAQPLVAYQNSDLSLRHVVVADAGRETPTATRNSVTTNSRLHLAQALLLRPRASSLHAQGMMAVLEIEDMTVTGVAAEGDEPTAGHGITLEENAFAQLTRVTFRQVRHDALEVQDGARLEAQDLRFFEILPEDSVQGRALEVSGVSSVNVLRLEVHGASTVALLASNEAQVTAEDVLIEDVEHGDCLGCSYTQGDGISATVESQVSLSRFQIRRVFQAGARRDDSAVLRFREGSISGSSVGLFADLAPNAYAAAFQRVVIQDVTVPILP